MKPQDQPPTFASRVRAAIAREFDKTGKSAQLSAAGSDSDLTQELSLSVKVMLTGNESDKQLGAKISAGLKQLGL